MFISNKRLDRRTVLRGMGTTIALPLLDAMTPVRALSRPGAVTRLAFVYFPHGAVMSEWTTPEAGRRLPAPGRILEPLAPFAECMSIFGDVENPHAYGPVHALAPATWLSGTAPRWGATPEVSPVAGDWTT